MIDDSQENFHNIQDSSPFVKFCITIPQMITKFTKYTKYTKADLLLIYSLKKTLCTLCTS